MDDLFFAADLRDAARDARENGFDDREMPEAADLAELGGTRRAVGGFRIAAATPADPRDLAF